MGIWAWFVACQRKLYCVCVRMYIRTRWRGHGCEPPPPGGRHLFQRSWGSPRSLRQLSFPPIVAEGRVLESSRAARVYLPRSPTARSDKVRTRGRQAQQSPGLSKAVLAFASWLAAARTSVSCTPESRCWRQRVDRPYGCAARAQSRAANS